MSGGSSAALNTCGVQRENSLVHCKLPFIFIPFVSVRLSARQMSVASSCEWLHRRKLVTEFSDTNDWYRESRMPFVTVCCRSEAPTGTNRHSFRDATRTVHYDPQETFAVTPVKESARQQADVQTRTSGGGCESGSPLSV